MPSSHVSRDLLLAALMAAGLANADRGVLDMPQGLRIANPVANAGVHADRSLAIPTQEYHRVSPVPPPRSDSNQRMFTPLGAPWPPNQLTPAPLLPFHPNRPLVTPPSGPGFPPGPG
jgi:hypothetical protein